MKLLGLAPTLKRFMVTVGFGVALLLHPHASAAGPITILDTPSDTLQLFVLDPLTGMFKAQSAKRSPESEIIENALIDSATVVIGPAISGDPNVDLTPRTIALTGIAGPENGKISDTVSFTIVATGNRPNEFKITVTMISADIGMAPPAGTRSKPEQGFPALDITDLLFGSANAQKPDGVNPVPAATFPLRVKVSSCTDDDGRIRSADSPGGCPDPTVDVPEMPEPGTLVLLVSGLISSSIYRRRRRHA